MFRKGQKIGGLGRFVSKLDEAQQRMERAISGLERAASARKAIDEANSAAAAEARISELESLNTDVTQRLNVAIDRVRKVLGS
jgi:hypothetical protein